MQSERVLRKGTDLASPRQRKELNMYQKFMLQCTIPFQKEQTSSPQSFNAELQSKIKQRQQEIEQKSRCSYRPQGMVKTQEDEVVMRLSTTLKETMVEIETQEEDQLGIFRPYDLDKITMIQCFYKKLLAKRELSNLLKQHNYRKCVIRELIQTEKSYIESLRKVVALIIMPLRNNKMITSKELGILFSNLEAILELSDDLLADLEKYCSQFTPSTVFANHILPKLNFFKLYFSYVSNYNNSFKMLNFLKMNNTNFKNFLQNVKFSTGLENELVKPVQRLPRYVLLFKDLLKNTPEQHPDYLNIKKCLELLEKVNVENNNVMDKNIINSKIFELQKLYGEHVQIVEATRDFIAEESLQTYFQEDRECRPTIVYILSDLILVTERQVRIDTCVFRQAVKLNQDSHYQTENMKTYPNLLHIFGQDSASVIFNANSPQQLEKFTKLFDEIISKLIDKSKLRQQAYQVNKLDFKDVNKNLVKVTIDGTQDIKVSQTEEYTQYVIEVDISGITQKIFLRFSQFDKLQKLVKSSFPNCTLPYVKDNQLIKKKDSTVIEQRKIIILNFLQHLLNNQEISKNSTPILDFLGLPNNFYELPSLLESNDNNDLSELRVMRKPMSQHQEQLEAMLNPRSNYKKDSIISTPRGPIRVTQYDLLANLQSPNPLPKEQVSKQSSNIKPQRANSLAQSRKISASKLINLESRNASKRGSIIDFNDKGSKAADNKAEMTVDIKVLIFHHPKPLEKTFTIKQNTKATELLEDIALDLNLQSAYDFKLFLIEKNAQHPLDDDIRLWDLLTKQKQDTFNGIFGGKSKSSYSYNEKRLELRKYLFFPEEQEKEMLKDLVRVEIYSQQLLNDIRLGIFRLDLKEYPLFSALYLIINQLDSIDERNIPFEALKFFVPNQAYSKIPKDTWTMILPTLVSNFNAQIMINIENNTQDDQAKQMDSYLTGSAESEQKYKSKIQYAQLVLLDLACCTQLYGLTPFKVMPEEKTLQHVDQMSALYWKSILKEDYNSNRPPSALQNECLLIFVGFNKIYIYQSYYAKPLVKIEYDWIQQINLYPNSISIIIEMQIKQEIMKQMELKFQTEKSYQLKSLLNEYNLNRVELEQLLQCTEKLNPI